MKEYKVTYKNYYYIMAKSLEDAALIAKDELADAFDIIEITEVTDKFSLEEEDENSDSLRE